MESVSWTYARRVLVFTWVGNGNERDLRGCSFCAGVWVGMGMVRRMMIMLLFLFFLGTNKRPYARMLQPSVSRWSPARVQRNRLHPIPSSMNRLPPLLRGETGAGVLPNTRLTPNWGGGLDLETVSTKRKRLTMTVWWMIMMTVMMMESSWVCPN